MNVHEHLEIQAKNRLVIRIKGMSKDSIYELKRAYSPLFYHLMQALEATRYKKETGRTPALLGGVRKDLLKSVDAEKFGVKFEPSDMRYDPWA